MEIQKVPLPVTDKLIFGESQDYSLSLDDKEKKALRRALPGHLVAVLGESTVQFYLQNKELGFSCSAIENARLYYMKRAKGRGWLSLEATLVRTNKPYRLLEMSPYTDTGLDWFLQHKDFLETCIRCPISVQDCGYDC